MIAICLCQLRFWAAALRKYSLAENNMTNNEPFTVTRDRKIFKNIDEYFSCEEQREQQKTASMLEKHGFVRERAGFNCIKRIGDNIYLEFDIRDNFANLTVPNNIKTPGLGVNIFKTRIHLPKKIDTENKLKNLLRAIT